MKDEEGSNCYKRVEYSKELVAYTFTPAPHVNGGSLRKPLLAAHANGGVSKRDCLGIHLTGTRTQGKHPAEVQGVCQRARVVSNSMAAESADAADCSYAIEVAQTTSSKDIAEREENREMSSRPWKVHTGALMHGPMV